MTAVAPVAETGLGRSATRGAAVTSLGQIVRIVVQLVGVILLARLLPPAAYGVTAMVLAITGIGEVFRDFGLSSAAIQARTLLPQQKTNLFWINLGMSGLLGLLVVAASGGIAALYHDDRLQPVAAVMALTFVCNGAATQFRADLNRRMSFLRLSLADSGGQVLALAAAVAGALAGFGYWALVAQQVGSALVSMVLAAALSGWWPGLPRRGVPMRAFLRFGSNLAVVQLLGYATKNIDSVVIGATVGATAVGLYNRAFQLMLLPLNQINAPSTRVALPVLSRLQDEPDRYNAFLATGQTILLNVTTAVLALASAQAPAVILIALGPAWTGAVPILQVLAVAGVFSAAGYACYWTMLSKALPGAQLRFSLVSAPLVVLVIAAGSPWGPLGVAVAYATAQALLWPAQLLWLRRVSDAPVGSMFRIGTRTLLVFAAAGAASWGSTAWLPGDAPVLRLVLGAAVLALALALTAAVLPAYRRDVRTVLAVRRFLLTRRSRLPAPNPEPEPIP